MNNYIIFDFDDWSIEHDCREQLKSLKKINKNFKVTLFTVPGKTTLEMLKWAKDNENWVRLGVHGWLHNDNYECLEWTMDQCMKVLQFCHKHGFDSVFKAPGWQISDGCYEACRRFGMIVADQPYNTERRPNGLFVYEVGDNSYHGHTWDCGCGNGIYEDWDNIYNKVIEYKEFKFISEAI